MDQELLKLKRQIRDFFNKNVNDKVLLLKVACVIGFKDKKINK